MTIDSFQSLFPYYCNVISTFNYRLIVTLFFDPSLLSFFTLFLSLSQLSPSVFLISDLLTLSASFLQAPFSLPHWTLFKVSFSLSFLQSIVNLPSQFLLSHHVNRISYNLRFNRHRVLISLVKIFFLFHSPEHVTSDQRVWKTWLTFQWRTD